MKRILHLSIAFLLVSANTAVYGQLFPNKNTNAKQKAMKDSAKAADGYPFMLPIWGSKVAALGYTLPYSAGLGLNVVGQKSDLIINNLNLGFNNGSMINMDDIVRFNNATATSGAINVRPDIWLFPFLNVYGILAKSQSRTDVDVNIQVPNGGNSTAQVMNLKSTAEFSGTTMGFGLTPTMGIGGYWMAADMNFTWTDMEALNKPAFIYVFGPRFGKTFYTRKPEQTISLWVGGFRVKMNSGTEGSLAIGDLIDLSGVNQKITDAYTTLNQAQTDLDAWYNGLSSVDQIINKPKYDAATGMISKANTFVGNVDNAVQNVETSSVQYSLDKRPADKWNFVVGGQYQLNRHWMVRAEYGFLGTRQQFIGGLQYRFGL